MSADGGATFEPIPGAPVVAFPERFAAARARGLDPDHATTLAGTLSLLSESTRLRILYALDQVP